MWLKASGPELLAGLVKIEKESAQNPQLLRESLDASSAAIESLVRSSLAAGGNLRGFKPHAVAFLGYLMSHESHHRGQIVLTLKQAGYPLDKKTQFGLWEWGVR